MKIRVLMSLPLVCLMCGCATSRYRIMMSGLDAAPAPEHTRKFRLYPCDANDDGTYSRRSDAEWNFVRKESEKYPDVFAEDGEVVRIRWLVVKNLTDGTKSVSDKDNSFEGPIALWNFLGVSSICTLPVFNEHQYSYRIVLEFESKNLKESGVADRQYDFTGYNQNTVSLIPPIAWFFPYPKPDDTPFYRTGFENVQIDDDRNHEVFWQAAVARAAVELRRANQEIDFRIQDRKSRQQQAQKILVTPPKPQQDQRPAKAPSPSTKRVVTPQSTLLLEEIPF